LARQTRPKIKINPQVDFLDCFYYIETAQGHSALRMIEKKMGTTVGLEAAIS